jgi:hypothetical protein
MIIKQFRSASVFALLSASLSMSAAFAQTTNTAPAPQSITPSALTFFNSSVLSISLPSNARLRLDVDARDEDILGVVKSLLRGLNGSTLKGILPPAQANNSDATGKQQAGTVDIGKVAALQLLSDTELHTLLENVNHLRVVVFETPRTSRYSGARRKPQDSSIISYYENAYLTREGGRRLVRADFDEVQMFTVGFPNRGFGVVIQSPGMGIVIRSDGYPDFVGAGPLLSALMVHLAAQMR